MHAAQEEIFGPVVTVIPFEDEADAVRIANDVKYGLMATVWTGDPGRGHRIAAKIKSGTVGINMPYTAFPGIPFGGYKQSGFGRELGSRRSTSTSRRSRSSPTPARARPTRSGCRDLPSYRWAVLAAGTFAQTTYSAIWFGVAVMAPALRARDHLSLGSDGPAASRLARRARSSA